MMKAVILIASVFLWPFPALAGGLIGTPAGLALACLYPASEVSQRLRVRFEEQIMWSGIANSGELVQVWQSGKTWTITVQAPFRPDIICLVYIGDEIVINLPDSGED